MAQVELVCGPYRMVSLMSAEAADELGLEPGVRGHRVRQVHQRRRGAARDPRPARLLAALALAALTLAACGATSPARRRRGATRSRAGRGLADGDVHDARQEFEAAHEGVKVELAFDSSATLAQQVTEGAPADVLATADGPP